MMKAMQAQGIDWGEDYRWAAGDALKTILAGRMDAAIDRHLAAMGARDAADRRNGSYTRHLLTDLGDIELAVPRTRRYNPLAVVRAYARRARHIDRMILACFVLGLSTARWPARCCRCWGGGSAPARWLADTERYVRFDPQGHVKSRTTPIRLAKGSRYADTAATGMDAAGAWSRGYRRRGCHPRCRRGTGQVYGGAAAGCS